MRGFPDDPEPPAAQASGMKKLTALALAAVAAFVLAGQATPRSSGVTTVRVVMHDPGCHWFAVGRAYRTTLAVTGPASLLNQDETTLRVTGAKRVVLAKVGHRVALGRGVYAITMVGQAPDDKHLKLVVR